MARNMRKVAREWRDVCVRLFSFNFILVSLAIPPWGQYESQIRSWDAPLINENENRISVFDIALDSNKIENERGMMIVQTDWTTVNDASNNQRKYRGSHGRDLFPKLIHALFCYAGFAIPGRLLSAGEYVDATAIRWKRTNALSRSRYVRVWHERECFQVHGSIHRWSRADIPESKVDTNTDSGLIVLQIAAYDNIHSNPWSACGTHFVQLTFHHASLVSQDSNGLIRLTGRSPISSNCPFIKAVCLPMIFACLK